MVIEINIKDLLTGLRNKRLSDASLFINDGTIGDAKITMKVWNDSTLGLEMRSLSTNTVFGKPTNVSEYTDAELDDGDVLFTGGEDGAEGVIEIPATLKNGFQTPQLDAFI